MSASVVAMTSFRFGLYQFDLETSGLRREGVPVRLQSQPAQVLALLVRRAGEIVSRDDLRKAIWGEDTFVDFDRGLNFCISQIRAALRDNAAEPTYIRTISKQGYQFIAPVEKVFEPLVAVEPPRAPKLRRRFILAAAALVIVIGVFAVGSTLAKRTPVVAVTRFDNQTGNPALNQLADNLTDDVVVRLTAQNTGRLDVVGNAPLLRLPRDQRSLKTISDSLKAGYVVLGQIQPSEKGTRILAHLIRLPEQKHLWVVRIEGDADPASLETEAATRITAEFTEYIATGRRPVSSSIAQGR